jgi:phospholipid transport system substrate-binding protein
LLASRWKTTGSCKRLKYQIKRNIDPTHDGETEREMYTHKFPNENWDDVETAVVEETPRLGQRLGASAIYYNHCLARRMKRAEKPREDIVHHAHRGLLRRGWSVITLALMVIFARPSIGTAGPAADQLMQSVQKIQAILSDPSLKGDAKAQERRQKLLDAIRARFDFEEMAKRSLGPEWQKRSPEEQKEFVRSFTTLLEGAYFDQLESYNGEKVRLVNERQDKDFAEVSTKIVNNKGEEFSVNYRLQDNNGDWKIFDVVVENVSLVNNFRSQFNRVLAKSSYAELVKSMNQKKISAPATKN